ncbi:MULTISPECIES: hypothetical protein [unclassified Azospirillum]|jgi:predicted double-glycine peptidase|uniref:hypothetical protein n=1 Tax=unclassified Azospirillum TaxID=2630922 RepID=UPI000B6AC88C|nr:MULTISPECIES: hypothetical protein [unclassified Azospirillum]SNT09187.1 hypothetical protein SAMN05880556_1234 [Azospirillum sp. RU38E]SNT24814.1 hypothetical protein SAMN05880591_1244 [Azospirillum sp. RU37A]
MNDPSKSHLSSWSSPFDLVLRPASEVPSAPVITAEPVIGTPHVDANAWVGQQRHDDTCGIRCQEFIIAQFTGHDPGEDALIKEATQNGWYHQGEGTTINDLGKLLEHHGIAVNRFEHANIFHLSNELAQGHKVMVGVHADGLWHPDPMLDALFAKLGMNGADHAVVVSGIDTSDPEHVGVIVTDPGTGEAVARYPLEQFVNAWNGSNFFMVATQEPVPPSAHQPEMANFDYAKGHVEHVWGLPYTMFTALEHQASHWLHAIRDILAHMPEPFPGFPPVHPSEVRLQSVAGHDEVATRHDDGAPHHTDPGILHHIFDVLAHPGYPQPHDHDVSDIPRDL